MANKPNCGLNCFPRQRETVYKNIQNGSLLARMCPNLLGRFITGL